MECPKCGAEQDDSTECRKCGIIFAKHLKRLEESERLSSDISPGSGARPKKKKGPMTLAVSLILLLLVAGSIGFWLGNGRLPFLPESNGIDEPQAKLQNRATSRQNDRSPQIPTRQADRTAELSGSPNGPATVKAIERARDATVFVRSPWGSGAGFFIDGKGHIVTNRHVIKVNEKELAKLKASRARLKEELDLEENSLHYLEKELPKVREQDVRQQLEKQVKIRRRNLARATGVYENLDAQIGSMSLDSYSDIKVTLLNGAEYSVGAINISRNFDLALLTIYINNSPYIEPSKNALTMRQGEKVFTIGNPSGLSHTVTSGIISGYREYNGQTVIQTDAPINPGNSGGPLIDRNGQVVGVNSKILTNTEGIGFAIPITDVEKEFSFYIQR